MPLSCLSSNSSSPGRPRKAEKTKRAEIPEKTRKAEARKSEIETSEKPRKADVDVSEKMRKADPSKSSKQSEKPSKVESSETSKKAAEASEKSRKAEPIEKSRKTEASERSRKDETSDRWKKSEASVRSSKAEISERSKKAEASERSKKIEASQRSKKPEASDRAKKIDRSKSRPRRSPRSRSRRSSRRQRSRSARRQRSRSAQKLRRGRQRSSSSSVQKKKQERKRKGSSRSSSCNRSSKAALADKLASKAAARASAAAQGNSGNKDISDAKDKGAKSKDKSKKSPTPEKRNGKRLPFEDATGAKEDKKDKKASQRLPFDGSAEKKPPDQKVEQKGKQLVGLGDLGQLQKALDEERRRLKLFVIKAKQEWEERRERQTSSGVTDEQDYYNASIGEVFGPSEKYQFRVEACIGKGVFSSVFRCKDTGDGTEYAMKFIRNNALMRRVSEKEVEMYRLIASRASKEDPEGAKHIVSLVGPETFEHRGHLCLVFGLLKCDLRFALQKYGAGKGLQLLTIQQYGQQIFKGLRALRRLKLIHGDLKPDNVLMSLDKTVVQLIDFGSAMQVSEAIGNTAYIQPRYYRAPEVMLGMPYDTQVDVWSLACTLFELVTTKILFAGATNNGMIKRMLEICGAFPANMRSSGTFASKHFNSDGNFLSKDPADNGGQEKVIPMESFKKPARPVLGQLEALLTEPPEGMHGESHKAMVQQFGELISLCTTPDTTKRITPDEALAHAFFKPPVS